MAEDFDLLETNSKQTTEKVDVNWGKAVDTMKCASENIKCNIR